MKKEYQKLDMDIVEFDTEDVITTSPTTRMTRMDGYTDSGDGDELS